ncbi:MAG: hypothetical protein EOS08_31800 [Mesorhizobium sp.]|nr:MAG: hypothetical protein EOS08_31800 [Mesorhizobium sp.]
MNTIPEVVTHNYDPGGVFLANLCDLPLGEAEQVLQRIRDAGKRTIKANYLGRRLKTEAWLINERQRLLGQTRRNRPIYFFLGDFADGQDLSRPCSMVMPLAEFPSDVLTFTYPDSMASLPIATRDDHRPERQPYHGQVFTLHQIKRVVEEFGMPGERWRTDHLRRHDRFIEVQVWDERPILEFLSSAGTAAAVSQMTINPSDGREF